MTSPTITCQSEPFTVLATDSNIALTFSSNILITSGNSDLAIYTNDLRVRVIINHNGSPCSIIESSTIYESFFNKDTLWSNSQLTSSSPKDIVVDENGGSYQLTISCGQLDSIHNRRYFKEIFIYLNYYSEYYDNVYKEIVQTEEHRTKDILTTMINLADYSMACLVENKLRELIPMFFNPGLYISCQEYIPLYRPLINSLALYNNIPLLKIIESQLISNYPLYEFKDYKQQPNSTNLQQRKPKSKLIPAYQYNQFFKSPVTKAKIQF